jgi:hypothetical protein
MPTPDLIAHQLRNPLFVMLTFQAALLDRAILARTRYTHRSLESNLNILTAGDLAALFASPAAVTVHGVRVLGVPSNLAASGRTT